MLNGQFDEMVRLLQNRQQLPPLGERDGFHNIGTSNASLSFRLHHLLGSLVFETQFHLRLLSATVFEGSSHHLFDEMSTWRPLIHLHFQKD
ncbi:unnamed protein product [Linum tenue]|uniref:Uncharacterized protein n=1 Tax=Linum tenue TaxID=586396 RepID=A0AAV0QT22_9ROSI|nr:unnamed protein product [Linum tenue]